jgi:hypothetical protein
MILTVAEDVMVPGDVGLPLELLPQLHIAAEAATASAVLPSNENRMVVISRLEKPNIVTGRKGGSTTNRG